MDKKDDEQIKTAPLKLNNFLVWGSTGCIVPLMSVYLGEYTSADSSDVGVIMLLSASLGTVLNLTLCSLSDRLKMHRTIYIGVLACALLSCGLLLVPIFASTKLSEVGNERQGGQDEQQDDYDDDDDDDWFDYGWLVRGEASSERANHSSWFESRIWFFAIVLCVGTGQSLAELTLNFSDSFSANLAARTNGSYGALRFWGSIGYCSTATLLALAPDEWTGAGDSSWLPHLWLQFALYCLLALINLLIVLLWPDRRPFEVSQQQVGQESGADTLGKKLANNLGNAWMDGSKLATPKLVQLTVWRNFDSRDDETIRNVRRCSLAPLGDSYQIEQFELNHSPSCETSNKDQPASVPEFKFVTKIEKNMLASRLEGQNRVRLEVASKIRLRLVELDNSDKEMQQLSLSEHFKLIRLICERDPNMMRFLGLYVIVGLVIAQNFFYLCAYLKHLEPNEFQRLAALCLISANLSETLFYYCSARLAKFVSQSTGLNLVLLFFALRYMLYLSVDLFNWPAELMVLAELLQALTQAWFNCIFNEAPQEFAKRLIETPDDAETYKHVDIKFTLLAVSACCFEGIGVALGGLVGGWLIEHYGYSTLWPSVAGLALMGSVANMLAPSLITALARGSTQRVAIKKDPTENF